MEARSPQLAQELAIQRFLQLELISEQQSQALLSSGHQPLRELINHGWVAEADYAEVVSSVFALDCLSAAHVPQDPVPTTRDVQVFLRDNEALPLAIEDGVLRVAVTDPSSQFVAQVLRAKLGLDIELCMMLRSQLLDALGSLYPMASTQKVIASNHAEKNKGVYVSSDIDAALDSDSNLVREVHRLIQRAVSARVSDIHFEPVDSTLRVRFRVHGLLRTVHHFEADYANQVIARIKLMAKLDVSEKRQAQNGRFRFPADGRLVDLRVSTLPLHEGESVVLRLLEFELSQLALPALGFAPSVIEQLTLAMHAQQGMMLITGPTGSGKSTTLYALLNYLNQTQLKLVSIEDPVEMKIAGVNQIQVDDKHGLGFVDALRTVLRQDPDVIMVGEIRDAATAQLAAQAALTGHLVLATLHTSSASSAFARLKNLGLPDYLQAATVRTVLAQRLLRTRCEMCMNRDAQNHDKERQVGIDVVSDADRKSGLCPNCQGSQYAGRRVIAELIPFDCLHAVSEGADTHQEQLWADTQWSQKLLNNISLNDDAQRLLKLGVTNAAEVYRVLGATSFDQAL